MLLVLSVIWTLFLMLEKDDNNLKTFQCFTFILSNKQNIILLCNIESTTKTENELIVWPVTMCTV